MSKKRRHEVLVGSFVCLGVGLFVLLLFLMGSLDAAFGSTARVEVDFGDAQSLQVGDPVLIFGKRAGKVKSIDILPPEAGKRALVRVGLQIPSDMRVYLREDSIVRIEKTITGNLNVHIEESDGKKLPEGARLRGSASADFGTVTQKVNHVLDDTDAIIETISRLVKEIESKGEITAAITEAAEILKKLRSELPPLADGVKKAIDLVQGVIDENRLDLRHTVANLKESSQLVKGLTEKLGNTPEDLTRSLGELRRAGEQAANLLGENRNNVDTLLQDLSHAATNASNLTAEIKRRPWRLLYRPSETEIGAMELYDAAWAYNLGATELNRSIRELAARVETDPAGQKDAGALEEARRQLAQSLRRHREAEETFWQKLQKGE